MNLQLCDEPESTKKLDKLYQATFSYNRWLSIAALVIFCFAIAFMRLFIYQKDYNTFVLPTVGYLGLLICIGTSCLAISSIKSAMFQYDLGESQCFSDLNKNIQFAIWMERISLISLLIGAGSMAAYTEYALRSSI